MLNKIFYKKVMLVLCSSLLLNSCQSGFQDNKKLKAKRSEIVKLNTELGLNYMRNKQYDDAEEKLVKAIKINPRNTDTLNAIALLKSRTNQPELASYYFQKALKIEPDNPVINNNYGQYLCAIGSHAQGMNYLKNAVKKYKGNARAIAFFNSGVCARTSGDLNLAISYMEKTLIQSPNYINAIIELASLMIQKKDYQSAEKLLARFNKLSEPTALSLYIGYLIAKKKGQLNESKRLRILLKNLFPFSKENIQLTKTS